MSSKFYIIKKDSCFDPVLSTKTTLLSLLDPGSTSAGHDRGAELVHRSRRLRRARGTFQPLLVVLRLRWRLRGMHRGR